MKKETNRRKFRLFTVAVCVIFLLPDNQLYSAKYITVATIGSQVPAPDKKQGMQQVVEQVIKFWHEELKQVLPDKPDLIVLPEYCDFPRGLSENERNEYLRVRKKQIQDFFAFEAKANHCYIAFGSRLEAEDGSWRNSCIIVDRNGNVAGIYNKNFPTIEEIQGGVKAGTQTPLIRCDFGSIGCAICFDLNFDELRRAYVEEKPDIIVFPSFYHGGLVQNYWAYSCRSFFVGSIAGGKAPSEIRDPLGEVIITSTNYFDYAVATINLDCIMVHLDNNWDKLTELKKKYGDKVNIKDPGKLGSVLISSEHKNISAIEMINEFGIESLNGYFNRSREFRLQPGNIE